MKYFQKKILIVALYLFLYFFSEIFLIVYADNSQIIINEIHPEEEFIEIKNISNTNVLLDGYIYSEESSLGIEKFYEFPSSNTPVLPGDFFVIELSRKINNSGDIIRIYDNQKNKIAEISVPKSVSGKSYSLVNGEWIWKNPTKGQKNEKEEEKNITQEKIDKKNQNTKSVKISEILPNPKGIDTNAEFIELYNNSDTEISLENFFLEDASGKKFFLSNLESTSKILLPHTYLTLFYSQTKISINNSNETIFLKDKNGQILSNVSFTGNSPEGLSLSEFSGVYKWTKMSTPNAKNILKEETLTTSTQKKIIKYNSRKKVELFKGISSAHIKYLKSQHNNIKLKIQKIFPSYRPDKIEVLCVKCDTSLEGIRLGVDGEVFKIPESINSKQKIYGKTGDILSFEFQNISLKEKKKRGENFSKKVEKTSKGWKFFVPVSGITSTDATVYIGDKDGKILDAVFYSNKNGYFQKSKQEILNEIIFIEEWNGKAQEYSGVSTVAMKYGETGSFLKRRKVKNSQISKNNNIILQDTNSYDDFFRGFLTDDVNFNFTNKSKQYSLQFSKFIFSPKKLEIFIENISEDPIFLSDYFLTNRERFLLRLDDKQKILYPHQKLFIHFPEKKLKTIKNKGIKDSWENSDIFLEIRDRNLKIFDIFCLESSKKSSRFRSNRYHLHLLKSPLEKDCFSIKKNNKINIPQKNIFTKNIFHFPISNKSYSLKKEKIKNIIETSSNNISKINKKSVKKIFTNFSTKEIIRKEKNESIQDFQKNFPIVFSKVLPNPIGKDSGREKIFLKNISAKPIFLRNFSLKTKRRKTDKKLPFLYFAPFQEKEILFFSGFSLKNSYETLSLLDSNNKEKEKVSWEKAHSGEFFGKFAPQYHLKKKSVRNKNKSKTTIKNKNHNKFLKEDNYKKSKNTFCSKKEIIEDKKFKNTHLFYFLKYSKILIFNIFLFCFLGGTGLYLYNISSKNS